LLNSTEGYCIHSPSLFSQHANWESLLGYLDHIQLRGRLKALSVPRREQFSESSSERCTRSSQLSSSYALGKLFASRKRLSPQTNVQAYFRVKWRLLSSSLFRNSRDFDNLGISLEYFSVSAGEYSVT